MKLTTFQLSKCAIKRDETKRVEFVAYMARYTADQLVFLDESGVDRRTACRNKGWGRKGAHAVLKTQYRRGDK